LKLEKRLKLHMKNAEKVFAEASNFLVRCQIIEPYVEKGTLYGCVCPWEIVQSAEENALPILEDFHDTLEAIWVWTHYAKISGREEYKPNIEWAWNYTAKNWKRFISQKPLHADKCLYDCAHLLNAGTFYEKVFHDEKMRQLIETAGNHIADHLSRFPSPKPREYSDPFWMTTCLAYAAKHVKKPKWRETAKKYLKNQILGKEKPFSSIESEPRHRGPGGHDFFSKNANKALALMESFPSEPRVKQMLVENFLPTTPKGFITRHADENAFNAHVATALGKAYKLTREAKFLERYFAVLDELDGRMRGGGIKRSPEFPLRESWATYFYVNAYASIL